MEKIVLPETWQEWEIIEKIGSGAFGTVYKARRIVGKQEFISAIKIVHVPPDEAEVEEMRRQMDSEQSVKAYFSDLVDGYIREINTMDELKGNSNIVSVEDYCVIEDTHKIGWTVYIRMEYLQSFAKYADVAKMTEEEVIKLGIDICSALECCEQLHIVHRDIKPDNIFIAPLGQYKLGDFGEARHLDRTLYSYTSRGTYGYMAPEVYYGKEYGLQADIYSLGIVLYRLMNHNREPFVNPYKQLITYSEREEAMRRRMTGEELPPPETASEPFAKIILKACAYAPNERYRNATEMKKNLIALQNQEAGTDMQAQSGSEETVTNPSHKKTRPVIIILAVVVVLIIVALIVRANRRQKEQETGESVFLETETEIITETETSLAAGQVTEKIQEFASEKEGLEETEYDSKSEIKTKTDTSTETSTEAVKIAIAEQPVITVIDISGCASFDFGESDRKAHKFFNKKKLRELLSEGSSGKLSEDEIEEIVNQMSLDNFTLDKTEDFQTGDVVTMTFTPNEDLQELLDENGLELKFAKISKIFQTQ